MFQLGEGSFGNSGYNTITLEGLRVIASVSLAILPQAGLCSLRIYGMTLSQINQLSVAGLLWQNRKNQVLVQAGDTQSGMSTIFAGNVIEAYPEFRDLPNAAFVVNAVVAQDVRMQPVKPNSYPGTADAAEVLGSMAKQAGLGFENNGVNVKLASPYFPGTLFTQIMSCIRAANIFGYIDQTKNILAIWPKTGSRSGSSGNMTISAANGMIGYPEFQKNMIFIRTIFDPTIKNAPGQTVKVTVESQLAAANGSWVLKSIDYALASQIPDGPWEMIIRAVPAGQSQ